MTRLSTSLAFAYLIALAPASGQIETPVTWTFAAEADGDSTFAVFAADIEAGWSVYSQYLESDEGPVATELVYEPEGDNRVLGPGRETGDREAGFDELFGMNVVKFHDEYAIRVPVDLAGGEPLTGYLVYMTCDETKCLPPTDVDFAIAAPPTPTRDAPATLETSANVAGEDPAPPIVTEEPATPAVLEPVRWSFAVSPVANAEHEYTLAMTAAVAPGWTVYAQDVAPGGPVPTSFAFAEAEGLSLLGEPVGEGERETGYDDYFDMEVAKYLAPSVTWRQRVRLAGGEGDVVGYLEYMTCDATQCLPPTEVAFRFRPGEGLAGAIDFATYDALAEAGESAPGADDASADPNAAYAIDKDLEDATCGLNAPEVSVEAGDGLLAIFLLGFGGGLLALLTPCVFPMIPLTVSFFTAQGTNRARGTRRALGYGASIIGIYLTLGLAITALFGADALNQLSTNAYFNLAFGILFIVFALSFFGFFEITLPSRWANRTDRAADQGGALGIFFMAFTLSLVSFSCTGPIIGTLLVETATGGGEALFGRIPVAPLVGMLGFAVALAAPFTLFAAFPAALATLPKSGGWMNTVKATLGFVELALALKFLSTADLIMGTKWLPYEAFVGAWVLCALGLAAYYFGWLKTPLERYGKGAITPARIGLGALALAFAGYVGLGFRFDARAETFDTPLVLSGLAPPAGHSYVYPKECPQDLDCFRDFDAGIAYAREVGKPLLVDFTGHGCVNCRKMEDNVWGEAGVYERLRDDYVLVSLYVDERAELPEPFVSEFSGRTLRTVGNKWADFQARYFDRNSQPYYVLMSPEAEVLNQPVPYTPDVEEYAAFLQCGLEQFERLRAGTPAGEGGLSAL